jgi:hypothetical protein
MKLQWGLHVNKQKVFCALLAAFSLIRQTGLGRRRHQCAIILDKAFHGVLAFRKNAQSLVRDAVLAIGVNKVLEGKRLRGLFP